LIDANALLTMAKEQAVENPATKAATIQGTSS
jgi:hypothetical protein